MERRTGSNSSTEGAGEVSSVTTQLSHTLAIGLYHWHAPFSFVVNHMYHTLPCYGKRSSHLKAIHDMYIIIMYIV